MRRGLWGGWISALALAVAMVIWRDLFLFSKSVSLPAWAEFLPSPLLAPAMIVFLLLAPAALLVHDYDRARQVLVSAILLSPLPCLLVYAATSPVRRGLWFIIPFHYGWIVVFHCLVPAVIWMLLRQFWAHHGRSGRKAG